MPIQVDDNNPAGVADDYGELHRARLVYTTTEQTERASSSSTTTTRTTKTRRNRKSSAPSSSMPAATSANQRQTRRRQQKGESGVRDRDGLSNRGNQMAAATAAIQIPVAAAINDERKNHYELNDNDELVPQQVAHYDTNLALYASDLRLADPQINQQQPQRFSRHPAGLDHRPGSDRQPVYVVQQPIGKFVDSYPSWRQSQAHSSGGNSGANYSFHVPLHKQQQQLVQPSMQQSIGHNNRQSRYGFVASAANSREARPSSLGPSAASAASGFKPTFRSKTIPNLPSLVRVTVDQSCRVNGGAPVSGALESSPNMLATDHNQNTYEDFYERSDEQCAGNGGLYRSEGDLLKAHIVDIRSHMELGHDNPFKPGTELSWEADMMVKLIKRGYPLSELPRLIEAAKQVAREDQLNKRKAISKENMALPPMTLTKSKSKPQLATAGPLETGMGPKQLSTDHLSPSKQVWANTIRQSKSLPRFTTICNPNSCNYVSSSKNGFVAKQDSDSIDRLITSIEAEMNDLLEMESGLRQQAEVESLSGKLAVTATRSGKTGDSSQSKMAAAPRRKSSEGSQRETNVKKRLINPDTPKRRLHQQQIAKSQTNSDLTEYQKKRRKPRKCCQIQ